MKNFLAIRPINKHEFNSPNRKKKSFSKLEARISLQLDYDNQNLVSYSGYSTLWEWNQRTVKNFIVDACLMQISRISNDRKALGTLKATEEARKLENDSPIILDKNGYRRRS